MITIVFLRRRFFYFHFSFGHAGEEVNLPLIYKRRAGQSCYEREIL